MSNKKQLILPAICIGMMVFMALALVASADSLPEYYGKVADVKDAQNRATPIHESLNTAKETEKKIKQSLDEAQKTVNTLQKEVDYYDKKARDAREYLCTTPETCTRENLDPAKTGVNLDEFFTVPQL